MHFQSTKGSMKINFNLVFVPEDTSGYRLACYTEGDLRVEVQGVIVLEHSGVLLVELLFEVEEWLVAQEMRDFYYRSMDFEEEPVIGAKIAPDTGVAIVSSSVSGVSGASVVDEVRAEFERFSSELRGILQ